MTHAAVAHLLLEVLEGLDASDRLSHGVVTGASRRPHKVQGGPERLVAQRLRGVDDVLSVSTNHEEATVAVVLQALGVELGGSEILDEVCF